MANYECTVRTNYFHVKDEEAFRKLVEGIVSEYGIELFEENDPEGEKLFGFGSCGSLCGIRKDSAENNDKYDEEEVLCQKLQSCVAEDDAVIILTAGNEGLRCVTGDAVCITHDKIEYLDLTRLAIAKAAEMLNNPLYSTVCEY